MPTGEMPHTARFLVNGNVLKLTRRFDPRYQSRSGMELINIVSSLAAERQDSEVVLDISDASAIPSMMIGIIFEAREMTDKAGKKLRIRLKKSTFDRFRDLGLDSVFTPAQNAGDSESMDVVAEQPPPAPETPEE